MHRVASIRVFGRALAASVLAVGSAQAAPGGTFMPQSFFGEAAVVALAFSLPALVAGAYLVMERLWVGLQRRIGIVTAAVGLIALLAVAALGVPGGKGGIWGGNWMVLARS